MLIDSVVKYREEHKGAGLCLIFYYLLIYLDITVPTLSVTHSRQILRNALMLFKDLPQPHQIHTEVSTLPERVLGGHMHNESVSPHQAGSRKCFSLLL